MPPGNDQKQIRAMVVEDQSLLRALFGRWLTDLPGVIFVGSARTGEEALALIAAAQPDVTLVDYQLPGMDGLEFIRAARQVRPQLRALVVSSLIDPLALTRIRESGVEGYVEKDSSLDLLTEALRAVANGGTYFSTVFMETISREGARSEAVGKILSRREQQVLGLVLGGSTNREIAARIGLSARTIEFHRANLMVKLDAKNISELRIAAQLRGWSG